MPTAAIYARVSSARQKEQQAIQSQTAALLVEEFARAGTEVCFVNGPTGDRPEDALLVQFQGMIAEYEKAQVIERTRRGKAHRAKQGSVNVLSGAPYGYRYVRKTDHTEA